MTDVCIAVGHGRRSDGTFDPGTTDGVHNEQRDAVPVARACTAFLRANGLDVESEHEQDDDPNWPETRDWANRLGCRVCVSIHYDYVLAPIGAFSIQTSDEGRKLGWAIEAAVEAAGWEIRSYPDDRDNLGLLNGTHMPCVIFECGRIGSEPIDETDEQEAMGRAIALGVMDYLDIEPANEGLTVADIDDINARLDRIETKVDEDRAHFALYERSYYGSTLAHRIRRLGVQVPNIEGDVSDLAEGAPLTEQELRAVLADVGVTNEAITEAATEAADGALVDALEALIDRLVEAS